MATSSPEFRIILDKINYAGDASVGSEWIFDFDFTISSDGQSFNLKQAISRNVSFNKPQMDINRTLVRANLDPATKNISISGKIKASEEGSNEKYSESGSGAIQSLSVSYNGKDIEQKLTANGITVKEYKGPKFENSDLPTATLDFEFKVLIKGISDNGCDFPPIKDPEVTPFMSLSNAQIEALQPAGQLYSGATTPGNFALKCCIALNEKNEYRAKVTSADAIVLWGVHTGRYKEPSIGGNITDCATADIAIKTLEKARDNGSVQTLPPKNDPWFPLIALEAHELSHVEDHEKLYRNEFPKIKKDLENLKVNLPANASASDIMAMQETLGKQYADKWQKNCITQITTTSFLPDSETKAQKATTPVLNRVIQRLKDFKKEKKCK